jgi:hypothetical protein
MGRFYARRYSFPPMAGRLFGYLAACDRPDPTIGELGRGAARQSQRDRRRREVPEGDHAHGAALARPGERMDRIRIDLSSPRSPGMDVSDFGDTFDLVRSPLDNRELPRTRGAVVCEDDDQRETRERSEILTIIRRAPGHRFRPAASVAAHRSIETRRRDGASKLRRFRLCCMRPRRDSGRDVLPRIARPL